MSPVHVRVGFLALFLVSTTIFLFWNLYFAEMFETKIRAFRVSQSVRDFKYDWLRERQHRVDWRGFIKPCEDQMGWGQTKPGWGKHNRSNAAASTISFWDIRPAGEFSKFLIQSRTADGRTKTIGGDWWRVYLRGPSSRAATIFDHSNGSYEALFLIMEPGVYRVLIYLDYSLCAGLKDPPRDWFIQDRLEDLKSPYENECRFLWDGFGRWVNNRWKPFLEQSFQQNASKVPQPKGAFWTYGDSLAFRFYKSVVSRPLCRWLYASCHITFNWIYPISNKEAARQVDDDLDFDRSRVISYIRAVLDNSVMRTAESTLFLNLGLHFAQKVNFTTFQAVLSDIVEMLREKDVTSTGAKVPRYKAKVVWKTNTAIRKERAEDPHSVSFRFQTAQRAYLFSIYGASVMCRAGYQVLDVYPLTDSFPHGTVGGGDIVHYADPVFRSVQELLEKLKVNPEGKKG